MDARMDSRKTAFAYLIVLIGLAILWWAIGLALRRQLADTLTTAVHHYNLGYASVIDLGALVEFSWDELYIFPPYTNRSQIEAALGLRWGWPRPLRIESSDSICLLVFLADGRVVRYVELHRSGADYAAVAALGPFTPGTAVFVVNPEGSTNIEVLQFTP